MLIKNLFFHNSVQGLDVWLSYLRTRESVLRRHYTSDSLMLSACRGHIEARSLSDKLIASLRPLAQLTFRLDLLYETRLLHQSLLQLSVSNLMLLVYITG